jgi:hypothetical protein
MARYDGCRGGGENAINFEWSCITKPFVMDDEPEIDNDRDQFWLFYSGDQENPEFGAEVEVSVGEKGKKQIITEPTYVWIPKGTKHSLVNFKTIRKPICFMTYYMGPEYSTSWVPADESSILLIQKTEKSFFICGNVKNTGASHLPKTLSVAEDQARSRMEFIPIHVFHFGWPAKVSLVAGWGEGSTLPGAYSEPIHAPEIPSDQCVSGIQSSRHTGV